jgi:hypothetical protein
MKSAISKSLQKRFLELGFEERKGRGYWSAEFIKNQNESISVGYDGTVYVHQGFNRYGSGYSPICIKSFEADTPAKIEVLVEPLLK